MKSIWSRAVQTSSHRCRACFHSATKLARRPTTAASKRRLKISDVFTLCYSAMFATAAVVDAKKKEWRRNQWDQAIEQARAGSTSASTAESAAALEWAQKESRMSPSPPRRRTRARATETAEFGLLDHTLDSTEFLPPKLDDLRREIPQMSMNSSLDTRLRNMDADLKELSVRREVPDEDLEFFATLRPRRETWYQRREPTTRTHLDRMEAMVSKLVQNLVSNMKSFSGQTAGTQPRSIEILADQFPGYAPLTYQIGRERVALNASIEAIFMEEISDSNSIDVMVANICNALLRSNAPPSIITYNIMLTHFTRLRQHHHAQTVVDSFFNDSVFRPDSRTISAILDHYTAARDKVGFLHLIKRMRAMDGDMRINRVHMSHLAKPSYQTWASKWKATHHNSFLYAKVHRDSMVFESLINGVLHFFGIRWATIYLGFAFREGCDISAELIIRLARICLFQKNKRAASKVLTTIVSRWHLNGDGLLESNAQVRKYMYQLLRLCGICPSKVTHSRQTLPDGLPHRRSLKPWLYCLRMESIKRELAVLAKTISYLQMNISKYLSEATNRQSILLQMQDHVKRCPLDRMLKRRLRAILQSHVEAVARHTIVSEELRRQVIDVVYEALPDHSQWIYDRLMKSELTLNTPAHLKMMVDLRSAGCGISPRAVIIPEDDCEKALLNSRV